MVELFFRLDPFHIAAHKMIKIYQKTLTFRGLLQFAGGAASAALLADPRAREAHNGPLATVTLPPRRGNRCAAGRNSLVG